MTDSMKTVGRTLTIVKPDAVKKNAVGDIIEQFEINGASASSARCTRWQTIQHEAEELRRRSRWGALFHHLAQRSSVEPDDCRAGARKEKRDRRHGESSSARRTRRTPKRAPPAKSGPRNIDHNVIHGSDADEYVSPLAAAPPKRVIKRRKKNSS